MPEISQRHNGLNRFAPGSLTLRLLIVMLIGTTSAQLITSAIWAQQVTTDTRQSLTESVHYLAQSEGRDQVSSD